MKEGDKVTYVNHEIMEHGIVKSLNEYTDKSVYVVYHCRNDWENYNHYTSASTPVNKLILGWI